MKNNNVKQQLGSAVLLSAIVLLSITNIVVIEKIQAIASSPVVPSDINKTTMTTLNNNSNNATTSLGLIAASPFYESKDGKVIGQRIVSTANGIP
jgi:hypothetical protein